MSNAPGNIEGWKWSNYYYTIHIYSITLIIFLTCQLLFQIKTEDEAKLAKDPAMEVTETKDKDEVLLEWILGIWPKNKDKLSIGAR